MQASPPTAWRWQKAQQRIDPDYTCRTGNCASLQGALPWAEMLSVPGAETASSETLAPETCQALPPALMWSCAWHRPTVHQLSGPVLGPPGSWLCPPLCHLASACPNLRLGRSPSTQTGSAGGCALPPAIPGPGGCPNLPATVIRSCLQRFWGPGLDTCPIQLWDHRRAWTH